MKLLIVLVLVLVSSSLVFGYNSKKCKLSVSSSLSELVLKHHSYSNYNSNNNNNYNSHSLYSHSLHSHSHNSNSEVVGKSINRLPFLQWPLFSTKKTVVFLFNAIVIIAITLLKPRKVLAAVQSLSLSSSPSILNKIIGWDLYGRIPLDDWLFNTWALCDPNLLKKSYVEAIVFELPDVMANLKRRKRINEIVTLGKGFGYLIGAIVIAAIMYKGGMAAQLRKINQKGGDNYTPTSAISKKAARKGKEIDNMDGWLDMEQDADDDDNDDDVDKKKRNKRKKDEDDDDDDE